MPHFTREAIDVNEMVASVSDPSLGGTAMFLGCVRRGPEDGPVASIDYSAYEEMLEAEFAKIVKETETQWPGSKLAAMHRIGRVHAGEPSIAVVAAAPHRAEAFAACRHAIEQAKKRLPVWKKEILDDGSTNWREIDLPAEGAGPRAV